MKTSSFPPTTNRSLALRARAQAGPSFLNWVRSIPGRLELQGTGAKSCEVSVASLLAELEEARSKATNLNQLSAAVRATAEKAKISGLLTQKVEVSVQEADKQAEAQTVAEILADVAKRVNPEAAIALARAFKLEIRDDGEIIDTDRHTPRSIGNIRQAGNASHPSHQHAVEWQPPKPDRKHELRRTAPV